MNVVKYTTEHLVCYYDAESKSHQIFEKKACIPMAIYIDCQNLKLNELMPEDVTQYKYFDEMKEIITTLLEFEYERKGD